MFSAFLLRTKIFRLLVLFHPPLDRAEILSEGSYLVVLRVDRSDCSKVTGTETYRPRTVFVNFSGFLFSVSSLLYYYLAGY